MSLPDGNQITYIYDGQGRRVGRLLNGTLTTGHVYQSETQSIAQLDGNGNIVEQFIFGTKLNAPDLMIMNGVTYQIISDQVGTPLMIVNTGSGQVVATFNFDEFGNLVSQTGSVSLPYGFAGGLQDVDTGLVLFGARAYDPKTGRFISKDPLLFVGGQTNLYGYSINDPINFIDRREPLG